MAIASCAGIWASAQRRIADFQRKNGMANTKPTDDGADCAANLRGKFIVLDGGDGAGKTTQQRRLVDRLFAVGCSVVTTREPGGCSSAEAIRGVLLDDLDLSPDTDVLLHTAARIEHVRKIIRPALARGAVIVCDRFIDSTYAYQGAGFGADAAILDRMAALAGINPDLVIVLDVATEVGIDRVLARKAGNNRYDKADRAFRCRVRQAFLDRAAGGGGRYVVIDAERSVAEVHEAIWEVVVNKFSGAAIVPDNRLMLEEDRFKPFAILAP